MRRLLGALAIVGAAVGAVGGVWAIKWYLWDVVIGTVGEPDRSMLFWGLPVAMIGAVALAVAALLVWLARRALLVDAATVEKEDPA